MHDVAASLERLPAAFTLTQAASAGLSRHVLARAVRSGSVRRVGRGLYLSGPAWREATFPSAQHVVRARAAALHYPAAAVSHHTAAALHGLPLPSPLPHWVALTTDHAPTSANDRDRVRLEPGSLPHDQVTTLDGTAVTTVARTLCDCLRTLALPDAVAMVDAAVGRGLTSADEVQRIRRTQFRWPGVTRIDLGLDLHDPVRESWLESSAVTDLWLLGVPLPQCQVSVHDPGGRFLGRPDAVWEERAVALELDGRGKYLDGVPASRGTWTPDVTARHVADAVLAERQRELRLEDSGLLLVRADHHEVTRSAQSVAHRLMRAFRTHDADRFRGELRPHPRGRIRLEVPGPPPPAPGLLSRDAPRKGGRRPRWS